jgi:tetratricopeptide (TPR) repeat protein
MRRTVFWLILMVGAVFQNAWADSPAAKTSPADSPASAQDMPVSELFSAGVKALAEAKSEKDYQEALSHFLAVLEKGIVHEDLYYNLGNTYYNLNQFGYAVYYFEKALQVHPGHEAARYNLELARQVIAQKYKDEIVRMGREAPGCVW